MLPNNQKFYRPFQPHDAKGVPITTPVVVPKFEPYKSDSEEESAASDTDSGSVTSTTSSKEELPNFAEFATNLQLNEAGGQNLPTTASQLEYGINKMKRDVTYSDYKDAFTIDLPFDAKNKVDSGDKIWKDDNERNKKTITSLIMLNSADRDRNVYPTPANLTLRLPRIYLNVTSMQTIQMKLLSSFLYFTLAKHNTDITINEYGRIFYNFLNVAQGPLNVRNNIREGTYNINTLLGELTTQLNTPPIFYDFPGGFNQFVPLFVATGNYGVAFNYPGDFFFNSLNRQYIVSPTFAYIINVYWPTTSLGFTPNLQQTKVAYYYPVLREYVLDPDYGIKTLDTNINTSALLPGETIFSRIVYSFQGVNDPIIQELIPINIVRLDQYRAAHTFRATLVNKYVVGYDTFNSRVYIQSPSLNTSLVNLLNTQYSLLFSQQLTNFGLTQSNYNNLVSLNTQLLSIVNSMYDYIQLQLAVSFGVDFNTFAPVYFTQPTNYLNVQNALNAANVSSNYDAKVIAKGNVAIASNIIEQNRHDPPKYWPNMKNVPYDPVLGTKGYPTNLGPPILASPSITSNYPYDITVNNFDFSNSFINSSGDVYTDLRRKAGDILVPLDAARYTVFKFRSLYRQTLQVETLPRPTQYRYPLYNSNNPYTSQPITQFFDNSYSFVFNSNNVNMDNVPYSSLSNIYGFSNSNVAITTNFGISYSNSQLLWGSNSVGINVGSNTYDFVFYLPLPPSPPPGPAYKHPIAFTVVNYDTTTQTPSSNNIPSDLDLFIYQDRAAFMADLSGNARNEKAINYKQLFPIGTGSPSNTVIWNAYAGQTYYGILRSANTSFQSLNAQVVTWYPDGNTYTTLTNDLSGFNPYANPTTDLSNFNFAQLADPDFIRLPTSNNLWGSNPAGNEVNQGLVISNVPIGYDINNVSDDLTDYVGYVAGAPIDNINPTATLRVDPITKYIFQVGSPYSATAQSYFYTGASNYILAPTNQSNYTPATVNYRQFKIVQWYDTTYLPDPPGIYDPMTDLTPNIAPYTIDTTQNVPISNYNYDFTTSNIQLGLGCCGFSFAPTDGIWTLDRVMFRSGFIQNDPNSNIAFLGVFLTNQANTAPSYNLSLANAIAKLNFTSKTVYSNAGDVNFGFDATLGTYYEFEKDPNFLGGRITGFSQNANVFDSNAQNFYSVLPFDANSNITYMRGLTGTPVPYPYVCDASAATVYYDGQSAPNRRGIVVPFAAPVDSNSPYGPPPGIYYTQSAYEQSTPIGTQITHYLSQTDLAEDVSGFVPWQSIGYSPSQMYADVSGIMMIQSTDFKFYSYPYDTTNRSFTYLFNLTIDQIYPGAEATTLVGAAGNSTQYVFLGFKSTGSSYQVRIKAYDVSNSILLDLNIPMIYQIPDLTFAVNSFSFTDTHGIVISGTGASGPITYRTPDYTLSYPWIIDSYGPPFVTVKTVQPPTSQVVYSLPLTSGGVSQNFFYSVNQTQSQSFQNTITILPSPRTPSYFNNICVTTIPGQGDQILLLSPQTFAPTVLNNAPSRYYLVKQITGSGAFATARVDYSVQTFITPPPYSTYIPLNMIGGANGSKWAFFNSPYYIYGNRNDKTDAPVKVQNAWQIFYPTTKIVLRKLANAVNPIVDLSGLEYPEFPHTMMFAFNTLEGYKKYIDNSSNPTWGLETSGGTLPVNNYNLNSNGYLVSDPNFSGFYFNSYIFDVPLLPSAGTTYGAGNTEPYYYLAIRNYTPSEKSQVLVRFNMPQRYDFGFVRLQDLSNEPILAQTNPLVFNPIYSLALSQFQSNFTLSNVNFGYSPTQGIQGIDISANGFGDFLRQYTSLYNTYTSNVQLINTITSNTTAAMNNFIQTNLSYVLPSYALTSANYTAALQFSILWRSSLTPTYLKAEDNWGLGYNLGYIKQDTIYSTNARATSFFKILDDYIYLKLNTEYDMNRMDFGGKENLTQTNEPQGQILGYNAKLLLNTFGAYAQTVIQNPVYFNPPILKLDKLSFQWYDVVGNLITNTECEWNAAMQIVEEIPQANLRGKNPVIIP
jgi:hypothetical protein